MNTFINKTFVTAAVVFAVFGVFSFIAGTQLFLNEAQAQTSCGSCGYSQSDYYNQSSYYSQSDYYNQSSYYTQADYYNQSSYYTQADYYNQSAYYTQADYYEQSAYYTQGDYYEQSSYYTQGDYYSQGSYSTPEPKCEYLKADGQTGEILVDKGDEVTLSWKTENADSGEINPGDINATPIAQGSVEVTVNSDTTYTLTVENSGKEDDCEVKVKVKKDHYSQGSYYTQGDYYSQGSYNSYSQGSYGGGSKTPKCDLDISAKKIKKGKEVTIEWETTNATDILLKDNHGNTLVDTDDLSSRDKKDFLDGKIKVKPTKDTTYTLIAERGSKDRECKVKIEVENEITVLEVRDQKPLVAGISLTQVPYTGFEAGPALTFIFYALLTLWALFVAYVLVIKKKVS